MHTQPAFTDLPGDNFSIAIISTRWNSELVDEMRSSAEKTLHRAHVAKENIKLVTVPGAYEIPIAAKALAQSGKYHAIIALGCVIRGETAHFDFVAGEAVRGIADISLNTGIPIVFGILTTENHAQAVQRASVEHDDKGREFALVALEMATLLPTLKG